MAGDFTVATFQELIDEGILEIGDGYRAQNEELGGSGPLFLRAGHVTDTHIDFVGVERFHSHLAERVAGKMCRPGDTVVTTKGNSTGRTSFVTATMPDFVYSPHLSYWRSRDPARLDGGFVRYWSRGREFGDQLAGMKASTDMAPYLSLTDQRRLRIILPPLPEQNRIAHILGTLDDNIDLNRRMNATLEAMSRAIFKSWFVDFDPVRQKAAGKQPLGMDAQTAALFPDSFEDSEIGEVPKGWRVGTIGDCVDVVDCLHTKKPERVADGKPLLQLVNIRDDGLLDMADTFLIAEDDYRKWSAKFETQAGDCVITNVGRVGAVAQIPPGVSAALGRNMTGLRPKKAFPFPTFLIECLMSVSMREEIERKTDSGTILNALNVKSIPRLRLPIPHDLVVASFERITRPIRSAMEDRLTLNHTLAALRDALLPKLLSGEVRVPEAEGMVDEAVR